MKFKDAIEPKNGDYLLQREVSNKNEYCIIQILDIKSVPSNCCRQHYKCKLIYTNYKTMNMRKTDLSAWFIDFSNKCGYRKWKIISKDEAMIEVL